MKKTGLFLFVIPCVLAIFFFILFGISVGKNSFLSDLFLALLLISVACIPFCIWLYFHNKKINEKERETKLSAGKGIKKEKGEINNKKIKVKIEQNNTKVNEKKKFDYDMKCRFEYLIQRFRDNNKNIWPPEDPEEYTGNNCWVCFDSNAIWYKGFRRLCQNCIKLFENNKDVNSSIKFSEKEGKEFEKKCKIVEDNRRAGDMLEECGIFELQFVYNEEDYKLLVQKVIKNNFDINKVNKIAKKYIERKAINMEKQKIGERQHKLRLKEKAEKEYFGKEKTKRSNFDNKTKEMIFDKFNNKCAICLAKEGLHIHHKNKNPKDNSIENLIVLCGVCHKKVHMNVR